MVIDLRSKRHGSVQMDIQYLYIHRVLIALGLSRKVLSTLLLSQSIFLVEGAEGIGSERIHRCIRGTLQTARLPISEWPIGLLPYSTVPLPSVRYCCVFNWMRMRDIWKWNHFDIQIKSGYGRIWVVVFFGTWSQNHTRHPIYTGKRENLNPKDKQTKKIAHGWNRTTVATATTWSTNHYYMVQKQKLGTIQDTECRPLTYLSLTFREIIRYKYSFPKICFIICESKHKIYFEFWYHFWLKLSSFSEMLITFAISLHWIHQIHFIYALILSTSIWRIFLTHLNHSETFYSSLTILNWERVKNDKWKRNEITHFLMETSSHVKDLDLLLARIYMESDHF